MVLGRVLRYGKGHFIVGFETSGVGWRFLGRLCVGQSINYAWSWE